MGLVIGTELWAQVNQDRLETIKARLDHVKAFSQKLSEERRDVLSGSAQNLIRLADKWNKIESGLREVSSRINGLPKAPSKPVLRSQDTSTQVSDPTGDFAFSVHGGFTQNETSTAWCGNNVVVGFNDSGSFPESLFSGPGGLSFNGVALSTDQGRSFQDLGFLNPGPNSSDFLIGDPVLGCSNASTFYYASLFITGTSSAPLSAISVSKSTDGGSIFANPVVAVGKDLFTHFLDKDWMTIDPTNSDRIFVTYTDFDFSGVCGSDSLRIGIEQVRSTDGGTTWDSPVVIEEVCSPFSVPGLFPQGSQVAVGPAGEVYVAWEFFQSDFFTRELRIRKSIDHGVNFMPVVKVDDVISVGDGFTIQGLFRTAAEFPSLAVDRSGTSANGIVYIAWHDGRNLQVPSFTISGFYGYADVLVRRSTDGGATWSPPVRVNDNPDPAPGGGGTDQYQPGIAVDKTGRLGISFYDRRRDPSNFLIDRFSAVSTDSGTSWKNTRQSSPSWAPFHATDFLVDPFYMGDYDSLASDFTGGTAGFIGAFQVMNTRDGTSGNTLLVPNPDVEATSFR